MEMCYSGALVMPSSYAVMDEEEMMYLEGGVFISSSKCTNALTMLGVSPTTYIGAAMTYLFAKMLIRKVTSIAGIAVKVVETILTWASTQVVQFGMAIVRGSLNNGVSVWWNWDIFKNPIGINYSVSY